MSEQPAFNPVDHLRQMRGGAAYLDVKYRVLWLNDEVARGEHGYRAFSVVTDAHEITPQIAIFRAEVTIVDDAGVVLRRATGWGSETPGDFGDFIEKAETKALGRALQVLGFGTAAASDDGELPVDAPVDATGGRRQGNVRPLPAQNRQGGNRPGTGPGDAPAAQPPTPRQVNYLRAMLDESGVPADQIVALLRRDFNVETVDALSRDQVSRLIERLQTRRRVTPPPAQAEPADDSDIRF